MEFLKSCTTNIYVLENVSQISCQVYKGRGGALWDGERWKLMRRALMELRKRNILCARSWHRMWVFKRDSQDVAEALSDDFELAATTTLEAATSDRTFTDSSAREFFLKAVEAAIAFKLARQEGMKHVGPWSWVISQDVEGNGAAHGAVLLRLQASLPPTGNMYLASETTPITLVPHDSPRYSESNHVIMVPQGILAQAVPREQDCSVDDDSCKMYITSYLETEGIDVAETAEWITVRAGKEPQSPVLLWPADLCLALEADSGDDSLDGDDVPDWHSWFADDSGTSFKNPLTVAEEWFQDAAKREQAMKELNQREKVANVSDDSQRLLTAHNDPNETENNTTTPSPFAQRTSDQQLAASGIYPTPPDGLTQATGNTQHTAESGSSSMQVDQMGSGIDLSLSDDLLQPHGRDSIGSAFQQEYTLPGDDLFGDTAEEMELGVNAVEDADFSFFDEPDDDRNVADLDDTSMLEAPDMQRESGTRDFPEHANSEPATEDDSKTAAPPVDDANDTDPPAQHRTGHLDQPQDEVTSSPSQPEDLPVTNVSIKPEKPLSPFGIRERLLPPPVPASVAQTDLTPPQERRRGSCFSPVKFREGFNLTSKYASSSLIMKDSHDDVDDDRRYTPNIGLPKRNKYRQLKPNLQHEYEPPDSDSDSEGDSYESSSPSEMETELPPKLPWETKKRKRYPDLDPGTPLSVQERPFSDVGADDGQATAVPDHMLLDTLETSPSNSQFLEDLRSSARKSLHGGIVNPSFRPASASVSNQLPRIEDVFDLSKQDLIFIAQIVSEQSISVLMKPMNTPDMPAISLPDHPGPTTLVRSSIDKYLSSIFPTIDRCDSSHVALVREPISRQTSSGKPQPGQPRPLQRSDSMVVGPDHFAIPPSYVRVQRGMDNWEMLPTCLSFWESLGLGPAGGPKNVAAFCIFPSNDSLQQLVAQFMTDLGAAYESCKLGTHIHGRKSNDGEPGEHERYEDGMAPVELGEATTLHGALKAYASTCASLGRALARVGQLEADRNIVVYVLHPFTGPRATQLLCACFWMLFKTYRDGMAKLHRSVGCDVVLQLLPIQSVTSFDALVTHKAEDMAMLAREVYDRCPPSPSRTPDTPSALSILAAPSVFLASQAPKKIAFQLSIDPPSDLLHEGSILHLAYATSVDGQWLTAVWIDNSGQHFAAASHCLRGRSFADVANDVWERTRDIIAARQVMWRVFVVTPERMNKSISQCWRTLCAKPRQQPLCVTLLTAQIDPALQLMPPSLTHDILNTGTGQESSLFTPASTPQATTFTNSPDVSSHTNAPPTPAPSETAATVAENDPDAHLTDVTDESWAMLLSPKLSNLLTSQGLANGMLFKRGDDDVAAAGLPSLSVSLLWTIQVKSNGVVDEGSVRHSELTLREVLRIYRNLAILTKARGLDNGRTTAVPLHIATALRGATRLDGMLSPS